MRKNLLPWSTAVGAAVSLAISSCAYDPYYSSAGGYYSTGYGGYGDGYGYGGSNFSTSFFVSTGDPGWGYDPYTYCYYDYRSRRYYDPYLYGYYPVGYRPYALYGVPHPHGWRPGHGYCPPPQTVRNVTVVNYRNRESAYRNTDYSWARQVRQQPVRSNTRDGDYSRSGSPTTRQDAGPRPSSDRGWLSPRSRDSYSRESHVAPESGRGIRGGSRAPEQYNTPVVRPEFRTASPDRFNRQDHRQSPRTLNSTPPASRPQFSPPPRRIEPSVPRSRPDFQRSDESRGNRGGFQRPEQAAPPASVQPATPPAASPPPSNNDRHSRGLGRGKLRSLGEG